MLHLAHGYFWCLVHSGLIHPLLALFYHRGPRWLHAAHDATARLAWPEVELEPHHPESGDRHFHTALHGEYDVRFLIQNRGTLPVRLTLRLAELNPVTPGRPRVHLFLAYCDRVETPYGEDSR